MCPIEITENIQKQNVIQHQLSTNLEKTNQDLKQEHSEEINREVEEDINNNNNNHRKRSCSSSTSVSLTNTEIRRSKRLLKKHIEEEQQQQQQLLQRHQVEFCKKEATMLSKIKQQSAASAVATGVDTRAASYNSHHNTNNSNSNNNNNSDNEDNNNEIEQSDTNNNNLEVPINASKLSQDELMDIIEVSRKRRLSKSSADTLGSFIRWSFSHIESKQQRHERRDSFSLFEKQNSIVIERNNNSIQSIKNIARDQDEESIEDDEEWSNMSSRHPSHHEAKMSTTEQLLKQHAKLSTSGHCGGSSAANLALLRHQTSLMTAQDNNLGATTRLIKRPRTHTYSPEGKQQRFASPTGNRKVSNYLGNIVERLHQQQQQQQKVPSSLQQEPDTSDSLQQQQSQQESSSGLSYHLQQFLSQQTSLEDLCSSVGLDDSNQLVLAAAIHRALVDSVGGGGGANTGPATVPQNEGSKSTASSTRGSSVGSSSNSAGGTLNQSSGANLHLIDAMTGQPRRRTYNTRGGSGSAGSGGLVALAQSHQLSGRQHSSSTAATLAALNINSRVQQQRHAQAAAALSALANAGSHNNNGSNHHHHNSHNHHNHTSGSAVSSASLPLHQHHQIQNLSSAINQTGGQSLTGSANGLGGNPMVDFECETCGSSFDDRHRLMQHQSIHLELKKDWFTETPVDEVMKIFNRRRGEFLCNTCNLRFEATFDYDKHNHQVHGQRPYCCQFCGNGTRTFRFWRQYLNHLYDHRYIFSCTIEDCDFTVNRRDSLRFHIFRFHLNCQLPQQQTHIRSAGHQHNMMLGSNGADSATNKWALGLGNHEGMDDDVDGLEQDADMNMGDQMID